jgi:hypothetical protein
MIILLTQTTMVGDRQAPANRLMWGALQGC